MYNVILKKVIVIVSVHANSVCFNILLQYKLSFKHVNISNLVRLYFLTIFKRFIWIDVGPKKDLSHSLPVDVVRDDNGKNQEDG